MSSNGNNASNNHNSKNSSSSTPPASSTTVEPTVISGWEHSRYANANTQYASERYQYNGKDETTGEPEWIDYGPKGGR